MLRMLFVRLVKGLTRLASASLRATPACAVRSAPQSLPPSPHMATTRPMAMKRCTTRVFAAGLVRAKMRRPGYSCRSSSGRRASRSSKARPVSASSRRGPSRQIAAAAACARASPFLSSASSESHVRSKPKGPASSNSAAAASELVRDCAAVAAAMASRSSSVSQGSFSMGGRLGCQTRPPSATAPAPPRPPLPPPSPPPGKSGDATDPGSAAPAAAPAWTTPTSWLSRSSPQTAKASMRRRRRRWRRRRPAARASASGLRHRRRCSGR
mmetsp:Transcript_13833/g.41064  ORF Transcript_13833/g.41064 Transcript_13833/m.41064 type:complete len:269 (+) Transcript_13833:1109-1915(+)